MGGDARLLARAVEAEFIDDHWVIPRAQFLETCETFAALSVDDVVKRLRIARADADTIPHAATAYHRFLAATGAQNVIVSSASIRDGILTELARMMSGKEDTRYSRQVIASACGLGRKFHYDEQHALHVRDLLCVCSMR
jgi:exopolyphosphatase/guanosine-5'-triphosphate,3'-diphosphate pyrophosphatase